MCQRKFNNGSALESDRRCKRCFLSCWIRVLHIFFLTALKIHSWNDIKNHVGTLFSSVFEQVFVCAILFFFCCKASKKCDFHSIWETFWTQHKGIGHNSFIRWRMVLIVRETMTQTFRRQHNNFPINCNEPTPFVKDPFSIEGSFIVPFLRCCEREKKKNLKLKLYVMLPMDT